jgi:hypothetical protein
MIYTHYFNDNVVVIMIHVAEVSEHRLLLACNVTMKPLVLLRSGCYLYLCPNY